MPVEIFKKNGTRPHHCVYLLSILAIFQKDEHFISSTSSSSFNRRENKCIHAVFKMSGKKAYKTNVKLKILSGHLLLLLLYK